MATSNTQVDIWIGNVTGTIRGPAPLGALDRTLNPHLHGAAALSPTGEERPYAQIFDPGTQTFLLGALPQVKRVLRREGVRFRLRDLRDARVVRSARAARDARDAHDARDARDAHRAGVPCSHPADAPGPHRWELAGPPLRDYQQEVVAAALAARRGIIDIGTGGGKTLLAAAVIARLRQPTLYLVNTRPLLNQTLVHLSSYLKSGDGKPLDPGVIGAGIHRPQPLTVALVQALSRAEVDVSPWRHGCLVFDEGHHACAPTYLELIKRVDARYNYFLSAVPFRAGPDQIVLDALTGGPLTGRRFSAQYLIDHGYACPAEVHIEALTIREPTSELPFPMLYERAIVRNAERNDRIVAAARRHARLGESVLVLVDRIRHGRALREHIPGAAFVSGALPRSRLRAQIESFREGRLPCLIATGALLQEGIDIHGIQVLIQAGAMKSRARTLQAIGRGLRRSRNKERVLFIDFLDDDGASSGLLREHSLQRLSTLRAEGFAVPADCNPRSGGHAAAGAATSGGAPGPAQAAGPASAPAPPPAARASAEIAPTWHHLEGTRRFLLVGPNGRIHERRDCVRPELVPPRLCQSCPRKPRCRTPNPGGEEP